MFVSREIVRKIKNKLCSVVGEMAMYPNKLNLNFDYNQKYTLIDPLSIGFQLFLRALIIDLELINEFITY